MTTRRRWRIQREAISQPSGSGKPRTASLAIGRILLIDQRNRGTLKFSDSNAPRAVIYARVSSKDQEKEGYSIPAQQKLLRDYAQRQGLHILQEYMDVETAKRAGRTAFSEMIAFLQSHANGCRTVLVEKTDRLYRNIKDWVTLDGLALDIHLVKENVILTPESRSNEKFIHGLKVLMAKNYIDNLSEEARKGMLEKASQGVWPSAAPLGYRNVVAADGRRIIEPNPEVAPLITRLFQLYATGNHSLREITRVVQQEGLRFRRSGSGLAKTSIHRILQNPIYYGAFDWKGTRYEGSHQPLVTQELWEVVQARLDNRGIRNLHPVKHNFAFSGLVTCGHCGCALVGEIKKGRYIYYHCTGHKGRCPEKYVREEVLAEKFGEILRQIRMDEGILGLVRDGLRSSHVDEKAHHENCCRRLQAEHDRLQTRLDRMYLDKLDGVISEEMYVKNSAAWREQQDRILRDIGRHQTANRVYIDDGVQLLELAQKALELYKKQKMSEKRRLINFVVSNSTWKEGNLAVTYREPFNFLVNSGVEPRTHNSIYGPKNSILEEWRGRRDSNPRPLP